MGKLYELFKNYLSLIGLIGMSFVQVLNLEPSDHSFLAFVLFTVLGVLVVVSCAEIIFGTKLERRPDQIIRKPAYTRLMRGAAAAGLAVTLLAYVVLAILFHIPNTWPVLVRAGVEQRDMDPWIRTLRGCPLDLCLDEAGRLFVPKKGVFSPSRAVHYIAIDNRSTVSSPRLKLHLTLQIPPERLLRPVVFAAAVATPAVHRWRPFGSLIGNMIFGGLPGGPIWIPYNDKCQDVPVGNVWCFFGPPDDRYNWYEPEMRLPAIPPRDSLEVYFELALREPEPGVLPATLDLRSVPGGETSPTAATGRVNVHQELLVNVRRDVDLNAGLHRR